MSIAKTTNPPTSTQKLVVDTDVASFVFKWHYVFSQPYVAMLRGRELIISFMTLAEMRRGALEANWGIRKCDVLEAYLEDFYVLYSDDVLCATWAAVQNESSRKGRKISSADAWIAATALVLAAPLATNNPKHFRHLDNLQLLSVAG